MTRILTLAFGAICAFMIGVQPAGADAINITYLSQVCASATATSGTLTDSDGGCVSVATGQGASALTTGSAATAGADVLTYNLGPSAFRALGSSEATALSDTSMPGEQATGEGTSLFNLTFDLILPHAYEYISSVTLLGSLTNGQSSGSVAFTGPGINFATAAGPVLAVGILAPGSYQIIVRSQSDAFTGSGGFFTSSASSLASFDLHMGAIPTDVTAVPEPASIILLGAGLVGAFARRRTGWQR